jgi:hypothetical protein
VHKDLIKKIQVLNKEENNKIHIEACSLKLAVSQHPVKCLVLSVYTGSIRTADLCP